ncbi:MAG TPA: DNA polymerase III subunit beta [Pirellulaceae bacterium]|nr:DNA polymerase III subunit beta [Pirellulaceae bacterium]
MKIEIRRETFLESFAIVGSVAPSRSTKPVLENIRIEATPAFTILLATNNEVGMRLEAVDVKVIQPGVALLPVSRVLPLLRETKDETLTIELNGDRIVIRGHQTKVTLQARDPDEFPPVASFDEEAYLTIRAGVLKRMLRRTVFATDNESSRFALGGVLLEFGSGELVAVATDGRRLAKMSGAAEKVGEPTTETMTIVPTAAISLLEKSLPDDDSPVHLAPRSNDILVRCGRTVLYSRLVEGRFPRWRDVFPGEGADAVRITLPVDALISAIRQSVVVADQESRGVDFAFDAGTVSLDLACANIGESKVDLPIAYEGEKLSITLDYRFFLDFLRALDSSSTFTMEVEGAERAALCTTDDGYAYVIMPLARDRR